MNRRIVVAVVALACAGIASFLLAGRASREGALAEPPERSHAVDIARPETQSPPAQANQALERPPETSPGPGPRPPAPRYELASPPAVEEASDPSDAELEYDALRSPVVAAVRRLDLEPSERSAAILEAVRSSGESDEAWTESAPAIVDTWLQYMPSEIETGGVTCYRAGCVVQVRAETEEHYRDIANAFRAINDPELPHGGRIQAPPSVTANGEVESFWVILRPPPTT